MSKQISIGIQIDEELYEQAKVYFDKSGLTFAGGVDMLIKKALNHKTLKQIIEEFHRKDFETILKENPYELEEIDWGKSVGKEVW